MNIDKAVALTRQELFEQHSSDFWHLLRCYVDGSELQALVGKGKLRIRRKSQQQRFLNARGIGARQIPVCSSQDFRGHRRLLQRSLRSLGSFAGDEHYAEGILLYGEGGTGKSSIAARLLDRLSGYESVVYYGGLNEPALLSALENVLPKAHKLLYDNSLSLEHRLRRLFAPENNPYSEKALLLIFDAFEQNIPLKQREAGKAYYEPEALNILNAVLKSIHYEGSDVRVIITSRFEVPVATPCVLHLEKPKKLESLA